MVAQSDGSTTGSEKKAKFLHSNKSLGSREHHVGIALHVHSGQQSSSDLPLARNAVSQPDASREDAVRITVVRDGTVYLQKKRVLPEDLGNQLRDIAEMKVYLAVDKRAKNEDVEAVLDQIRLARITSVVILANESTP
jgi:biopolymer transport protein ExbD